MLMYVKLFASLYQGTLRGCPDEILVFTNLLAHADMYGVVDKHWRAISEETGLSRERVEAAILNLEAPDPESRSPEEDGRRIIRIDEHRLWGWQIVNYGKYREIRNADDRRAQNREAQKRWRDKHYSKQNKPRSAHAEADAEVNITTLSGKPDACELKAVAKRLLDFLNEKTGRQYRHADANLDLIVARLRSGFTEQDCKTVIARKIHDWGKDDKMRQFLRPNTLFNRTKFEQYFGECV